MSKLTITRLFIGAVVAVMAGTLLTVAAVLGALANGFLITEGGDVTGINASAAGWGLVTLAIVGALAVVGGAIAGLVSWIGALLNTVQLEDKMWFVLLLVLGLLSFGFIAMIAYVIAGPDGTDPASRGARLELRFEAHPGRTTP